MISIEKKAEQLLEAWETADGALRRFRARNEAILEKAATLETDRAAAHTALRELFDTRDGPPAELPPDTKSHIWVKSAGHAVEVQYKRHADSYDPAKLPIELLKLPGVVTRVDDAIVRALVERYPSVSGALMSGAWMKPVVVIRSR